MQRTTLILDINIIFVEFQTIELRDSCQNNPNLVTNHKISQIELFSIVII